MIQAQPFISRSNFCILKIYQRSAQSELDCDKDHKSHCQKMYNDRASPQIKPVPLKEEASFRPDDPDKIVNHGSAKS